MKIEIKNEINNVKLLKFGERYFILMPLQFVEDSTQYNEYKKINIVKWKEEGTSEYLTLIEFLDDEFIFEIFDIISSTLSEEDNIFSILNRLNNFLSKDNSDYLKLRGDIGEALFLMNIGGKKTDDSETFDIILGDQYIEVKTYSPQARTINISLQQLQENTLKYAVPIYSDQEGMSIRDMAKEIESTNSEFYQYIMDTYKDNQYLSTLKFKNEKPFEITNQLKGDIVLPDYVISAHFKVNIKEK